MPADASDAELAEAARRDPAAFEGLYRRYLPGVYRYALSRTGSVACAEDVTASAFMEALTGLAVYREQGRFPAWLFTIARRQVQLQRRRSARETGIDVADLNLVAEADDPLRSALLARALADLSEERQEALALRYFGGLKVREVAALMGKGESAVKMLLHRALLDLRAALSEADDEA
jgi:RNA polymerase sigma-70 factor, ECF subfamily